MTQPDLISWCFFWLAATLLSMSLLELRLTQIEGPEWHVAGQSVVYNWQALGAAK